MLNGDQVSYKYVEEQIGSWSIKVALVGKFQAIIRCDKSFHNTHLLQPEPSTQMPTFDWGRFANYLLLQSFRCQFRFTNGPLQFTKWTKCLVNTLKFIWFEQGWVIFLMECHFAPFTRLHFQFQIEIRKILCSTLLFGPILHCDDKSE